MRSHTYPDSSLERVEMTEEKHPILQYATGMRDDHVQLVEEYRQGLMEPSFADRMTPKERVLAERLVEMARRAATLSQQLVVTTEKLSEIEKLARIYSPEVFSEQLQEVLNDPKFIDAFSAPCFWECEQEYRRIN